MKKNTAVKLNLGCGLDKRKGWINIDAFAGVKPDFVHDLLNPLPFSDGSAEYVLAQDILEHFTKEDVQRVIAEIGRVLATGGKVEVRVPNIDDIIVRFAEDKDVRNQFLYGTTEVTGVFGAHKVGFTPELLTRLMLEHGMTLTTIKAEDTNYHAVFVKTDHFVKLESVVVFGAVPPLLQQYMKGPFQQLTSFWQLLRFTMFGQRPQLLLLSGFTEQVLGTVFSRLLALPVVWLEFSQPARFFSGWLRLPKVAYYLVKEVPIMVIVPSEQHQNELIATAHVSLGRIAVLNDTKSQLQRSLQQLLIRALYRDEAARRVNQLSQ